MNGPAFRPARRQRGAALLLAMLILTLVATLAAGMVWQQWRAIQVEAVERVRTQATWILGGALDWARLILREDNKSFDALNEVWATPLAEAKLSTFLSADKENSANAPDIEAFLSGAIVDAQSRYDITNLMRDPDPTAFAAELAVFAALCERIGLPTDVATRIALPMRKAAIAGGVLELDEAQQEQNGSQNSSDPPVIMPNRLVELAWLGIEPEVIDRLRPYADILPEAKPVNINTASVEVLSAVLLDPASAQRLVQARQRQPFENLADAKKLVPTLQDGRVAVASNYFEILGRLRYEETVIDERSLVRRDGTTITLVRRERVRPETTP